MARSSGDGTLTPARAFTSLTLFTLLSTPLSNLVEAVTGIATAVGSIKRINLFLQTSPRDDGMSSDPDDDASTSHSTLTVNSEVQLQTLASDIKEKHGVECSRVSVGERLHVYDSFPTFDFVAEGRSTGWDEEKANIINDATFKIQRGTLTIVVGPVGCGKSTFVRMLLRETPISTGTLHVEAGVIAYCAQVPWLTNRSMQDNILGESLFDLAWYNTVVQACALEKDILDLPNRDQGLLGSGGATLSGGQRQRVVSLHKILSINEILLKFWAQGHRTCCLF